MNHWYRSIIAALTLMHGAVLPAGDWPCWRGPNHDGRSAESIDIDPVRKTGLLEKWKANVGTGFSSCVVSDGKVVTLGNSDEQDTIYCFDVTTGEAVWKFSYAAPLDDRDFEGGPTATPLIDAGQIFSLSREGDVRCLKLETGELVWERNLPESAQLRIPGWGFGGSPRLVNGMLLLTVGESGVALDPADGSIRWASADKESGYASPVVYRSMGKEFALFPSGRTYTAVVLSSGQVAWQQRWLVSFGCNAADPIVDDGHMFLSSAYNRGCALLRLTDSDPEMLWKNKDMQNHMNGCVLIDGFLYGAHGDLEAGSSLRCMNWSTGAVAWTNEDIQPSAVIASAKHLIVMTVDGQLLIGPASSSGFEVVHSQKVLEGRCWTVPVLSNGLLFCRNASGEFVCYSIATP